jgi:Bacterial regulatory proteins, luxR family
MIRCPARSEHGPLRPFDLQKERVTQRCRRVTEEVSVRTVDTHRAHIMRKLQLQTRAELVLFALANGLIGAT